MRRHLARRRRTPEVARAELLDAAERVFAKAPPDKVGLKEVAEAAGTSHGLITHYFGTYDGLVAATLQRRTERLRERVFEALQVPGITSRPDALIDLLFATFEDPVHLRLMSYLVASERPDAAQAFAQQVKGITLVADRIAETVRPGATPAMRETAAMAVALAVAAAYGWAATRHSLAGALGRSASATLDRDARHALASMVQRYIFDELS